MKNTGGQAIIIPREDINKLEQARIHLHKLVAGTKLEIEIPFGVTDVMYAITHKNYKIAPAMVAEGKKELLGRKKEMEIYLSDIEQRLSDFIKEASGVSIEQIKENLGIKYVGAIGKLMRYDKVEKTKRVITDAKYGERKFVTYYIIKESKEEIKGE